MTLLPIQLQNETSLYALNEKLRSLRAEFIYAVSQAQTGAFSISKAFSGLPERLYGTIDELLKLAEDRLIPKDRYEDFLAGDATLDEWADYDSMKFCNELRRLRFSYSGAELALLILNEAPTQPMFSIGYRADDGLLEVLDDREFLEQGFDNPVSEVESTYSYYEIRQGDTLQSISARFFNGDYSRFTEIARFNDISDSDLIDEDLIGKTIKIPTPTSAGAGRSGGAVFEPAFDGESKKIIERWLYGRDLFLDNGMMKPDGSGDLRIVEGLRCVTENVRDRFDSASGSLNPLHPDWGMQRPANYGYVPFVIVLDRTLKNMEAQASADPRAVSASIDPNSIRINGDSISVSMTVALIGRGSLELTGLEVPGE